MRRVLGAMALALLVGCGSDFGADDDPTDGVGPDAGECSATIVFDPPEPLLGMHPQIRATAETTSGGVFDYQWEVFHDGSAVSFLPAQAGSMRAIRFDAPTTGVYTARVTVPGCGFDNRDVVVANPSAGYIDLRLRVIPPPSVDVPPIDKLQRVFGGGDKSVTAYFDRGVLAPTRVTDGASPVEAYVRFMPTARPAAAVEAFTQAGVVSPQLVAEPHHVLVVPVSQTLAPTRIESWDPTLPAELVVSTGSPITGTIVDGAGAPLAAATIQLVIDGVPSTYATTAADGTFTARASVRTGPATIAVTPPAGSGLPRLSVTTAALDLTVPLAIAYAPLPMRDLAGARLEPAGAARVVVTGSFDAGTIRTGPTSIPARGSVHAATSADASGVLASARVPATLLTAVISDADSISLASVDLSTAVPATITAPAMTAFSTTIMLPAGEPASAAELEAIPLGPLAAAGVQPVRFRASAAGLVTGSLVAGARYQLRFRDPAARAATRIVETEATAVAASYPLVPALTLHGTLVLSDSQAALDGAIVQMLCGSCEGIDRDRPLAEAVSDGGEFRVSVPDMEVQ